MQIELEGVAIHCETVGDGPAVVFLHGLGSTSNVWHGQRLTLAKFFRVVTLDLPGSGRSSKTETTYSMEAWVAQLAELADRLQLGKFVLVGHSMSTILAQNFAARHPDRVRGLVLCGPLVELAPAAQEAFTKRADLVKREGMIAVADAVLAGALTAATREGNGVLTGLYREMLLANDPLQYAAQIGALQGGSAKADPPRIACPMLLLVGDQDTVTPLANAREIAAGLRDGRIEIIPATAHLTMAERPDLFNLALANFLAAL
jgi:3-oxoadipate enol-lactonase